MVVSISPLPAPLAMLPTSSDSAEQLPLVHGATPEHVTKRDGVDGPVAGVGSHLLLVSLVTGWGTRR